MTNIVSNGSKWNGQKPDSINKLIQVLKTNTIESRFFAKHKKVWEDGKIEWVTICPIAKQTLLTGERNKHYTFFGNFEEVSHVFNIETDEPKIIAKLKKAVMQNEGWKKYLSNLKTAIN